VEVIYYGWFRCYSTVPQAKIAKKHCGGADAFGRAAFPGPKVWSWIARRVGADIGNVSRSRLRIVRIIWPGSPHPVSVSKFLVFIDLRERLRCKFFIMLELFAEY
jgi:hypothetical protein